jgi:carbon starvation protein
MIFNDRIDAAMAAFFMIAVVVILVDSINVWVGVVRGRRAAVSTETPFTPRPLAAQE